MKIFSKLLEYIFFFCCGICKKIGEGYLCDKCGKELRKYRIDLIENEKFYIFKYKDIIRKKLIEYKFNDKPYLFRMFCEIILEDKKTCEFLKSYDIIIPVPVHRKRKRLRGYNQSELIAKELAKKLKLKVYTDVLVKINNNKVQSKLNKEERMKNVKNVYKIINKEKIKNKNIIILDDIYTTGATINECIKELEKTDANKIGVLILAKD